MPADCVYGHFALVFFLTNKASQLDLYELESGQKTVSENLDLKMALKWCQLIFIKMLQAKNHKNLVDNSEQ